MLHGQKEVLFVSIIMFIIRPDALSLNGSVMINQSINQSSSYNEIKKTEFMVSMICGNIRLQQLARDYFVIAHNH